MAFRESSSELLCSANIMFAEHNNIVVGIVLIIPLIKVMKELKIG